MTPSLKIIVASTGTLCLLASVETALACSDLPNICAAQAQHHQEMVDTAATPQLAEDAEEPDSYAPPPDPMQVRMGVATGMISLMQTQVDNVVRLAELKRDPLYQRYENGAWDFFQDHPDAEPGEYCSALWWKKDAMVRISGPGRDYSGALLTFWSKDIPRPAKVQTIKVALTQTDTPVQTVKAFNYVLPNEALGAIALAVPSIEAALEGMTDVLAFDLAIDGKSVVRVDWTGGNAARDALQKCVDRRAKR